MSAISDMLMQSALSALDPTKASEKEFISKTIEKLDTDIAALKRTETDALLLSIAKAKEMKAPKSVIEAYERLLDRVTKS